MTRVPVLVALALLAGCPSGSDAPPGKRVMGTENRERWVVTFEGNEPDLSEYRGLLRENPDEAAAYAEKMRKKLSVDHAAFESSLESIDARIVERWWMSNQVTVEVDPSKAPSLEKQPGVKSLTPDTPLEP